MYKSLRHIYLAFVSKLQTGSSPEDLLMRSISPQSPLLAGELPPHAPSAFAPSPREEGEEEEKYRGEDTQSHTATQ